MILWLELAPQYEAKAAKKIYDYFQEQLAIKTPKGATFVLANAGRPFGSIIMTRDNQDEKMLIPREKKK